MRLIRTLGAILFAGALTAQAASIVERHGALTINAAGNAVVDQAGKPLQLTGMSLPWDLWAPQFFTKAVVDTLVSNWKISVLRVPLGITDSFYANGPIYGAYPNDSAAAIRRITTAIDAAISDGIYVIIDWHDYDTPKIPNAKAFFAKMAKKYGDLPNVAFEIWNEPVGVEWTDIQSYADSIIPVIRTYSTNLIIVGIPSWSGDLTGPVGSPITSDPLNNIAYTFHFYSCTHATSLVANSSQFGPVFGTLAATPTIPVFVTEWGTTNSDGGAKDTNLCITTEPKGEKGTPAQTWFSSWLDLHKISTCNWQVNNTTDKSSALLPDASGDGLWGDSLLSTSGTWVRSMIQSHCTKDPTVCPYEGAYAGPPVLAVPGILPATSFTVTDGILAEPTQESSGGRNLTSIDSGDYVTYSIRAASADTLWFKARVADTSGGLILVKLDAATVDTIRVYPTGGVQTWSWADGIHQIPVAAGAHTLTLQFLGKGRDLLRLQRLEAVSKPAPITTVPSQISLENFNGPMVGLGLGNLFGDSSGPSLRQATTRSIATYKVSAVAAESLSLSIVAANGGSNPASVVVWKKVIPRYVAVDTIVVAPSGWTTWQTLSAPSNVPLDSGTNLLEFTFLGDTGKALVDVGALSIGSVVTQLHPSPVRHSLVSLRREGRSLRVELPAGAGEASVELLSADGRVWARQTVSGSSSLALPSTHQPLWVRVRGQSSAVLAVPPGF